MKYCILQIQIIIMYPFDLIQPESDFSTLSLHEPTPEEKEKAEKLKNEGIS